MDYLQKENFKDIIAFSISEPGAMGPHDMTFYRENGLNFRVNYLEDGNYEKLKELYPALQGCYWDGPMKNELASLFTVVIGGSPEDRSTTIPEGMKHIYLDFGNHLVVKEEFYYSFKEFFSGVSNADIMYRWTDYFDEVVSTGKLDEVRLAYFKQKERDEMVTNKIAELNKLPEYREKIKNCNKDMDAMMNVLKEYGLEIDWFELKQIGFRQRGLI